MSSEPSTEFPYCDACQNFFNNDDDDDVNATFSGVCEFKGKRRIAKKADFTSADLVSFAVTTSEPEKVENYFMWSNGPQTH